MYYPDLSAYSYANVDSPIPQQLAGVFNVGWIERGRELVTGVVPEHLLTDLRRALRLSSCARMRGYHECEFCWPDVPPTQFVIGDPQETVDDVGEKRFLGSSEIWVPGPAGIIYAAPDLIVHYVEHHHYLPPPSFIAAIGAPWPEAWNAQKEYKTRLRRSLGIPDEG